MARAEGGANSGASSELDRRTDGRRKLEKGQSSVSTRSRRSTGKRTTRASAQGCYGGQRGEKIQRKMRAGSRGLEYYQKKYTGGQV